jgi:hypothetical protein
MFINNVGIQDLLIQSEQKLLQLSRHVKTRMDETNISGGELKLKFKRKRPIGLFRTKWFSQILEDIKKGAKSW